MTTYELGFMRENMGIHLVLHDKQVLVTTASKIWRLQVVIPV